MKILSINTFFPFPTRRGMDVVYLNLLKTQALKHDVTVLSMRRGADEDAHLDAIRPYVSAVHLAGSAQRGLPEKVADRLRSGVLSNLLWRPASTFYDNSPAMARLVAEVSGKQKFDVVEVHHSPSAGLIHHAQGDHRLLYMYDVHFRSAARLAETKTGIDRLRARAEASRYRNFEPAIARAFDGVLFGQEEDERTLTPYLRQGMVTGLMPNIVDTDRLQPAADAGNARAVIFVGAMSHRANVDAIQHFQAELWDKVRERAGGEVELWLVGATPPPEILALDGQRGIRVHADVPDVRPFIDGAMVYVAPLRIGSGVKVKIMEALAMGKAIVASPVAAEGMGLADGTDLVVRELGDGFADAVAALLADGEARAALQVSARQTAIDRFGFARGATELDAIYARLGS